MASATLTIMAGALIAPVLNLMGGELGVDPASVGLIITTHALFIAIFSPLIGSLIDKMGAKKPFIVGLIIYGLAGGSGLFITSYWVLIISRAIMGIAVAAVFVSITVLILNLYKGAERNKIMGWRGSANSFGGIIWPIIGGFLGMFSWHLPFAAYLLSIPLGLLAVITIPETCREKTQDKDKEGSLLKVLRSTPTLFVIYGLMFLAMVLLYTIVIFLPQRLAEIGITNPFYISLFIAFMALSAGIAAFNYGKIKTKLSYKMLVFITLALWAVGLTTLSQVVSILFIAASIILFGIGQGLLLPAVLVWAGEKVTFSFRGRITSYLATFGFIGQFSSPLIFGPVLLELGLNGVFLSAGAVCIALFVLFSVGAKKITH
ncbi:MAG: MFS transporter [Candidatus Bathyarchaeota archaeon]